MIRLIAPKIGPNEKAPKAGSLNRIVLHIQKAVLPLKR